MSLTILVDGNSIANRYYYGAKGDDGGLTSKSGVPISICSGFIGHLAKLISEHKPDRLIVAFDCGDKPTFRHRIYPAYKLNRTKKEDDFYEDFNNLEMILNAIGCETVKVPGYEADDIIGTLAQIAINHLVKIASCDKDLYQLIDPDEAITVIKFDGKIVGVNEVVNDFGISPWQIVDYLALVGDASDNIPGVKGIGAKGAIKLLQEYSSIEKIYASEDSPQILPKVWTKLQDGEGSAILSKELATIYKKVPFDREINGDIGDIQVDNFDSFNELGLRASFDKLRNSLNLIYSSGRYIFRNAPF